MLIVRALFAFLLLPLMASAQAPSSLDAESKVSASLIVPSTVAAGQSTKVAIRLEHAPTWHTYYLQPGESGLPTTIAWDLPEGWTASEDLQWPVYEAFIYGGITSFGYSDSIELLAEVTAPADLEAGEVVELAATVDFLMCDPNMCVPGSAQVSASTTIGAQSATLNIPSTWNEAPEGDPMELLASRVIKEHGAGKKIEKKTSSPAVATLSWAILGGAFVGGLILNLMPCVFPILGIKVLSFAKQGGNDRAKVISGAVAYALGIVASLLLLGVAIAALKSAGESLGWGFQLQNPFIVWGLLLVVMAVGLNLLGAFELPAVGGSLVGNLSNNFIGNFFSGVLMVGLATPCSAPFLAGALGSIFVLPFGQSLVVLLAMGLGLAAPYLLLSAFPQIAKAMPKPGEWMVLFKKILAFPMFAAAAYLLWIYAGQIDNAGTLLRSMLWVVGFSMALWLLGMSSNKRIAVGLWGGVLFVLSMFMGAPYETENTKNALIWQKWSPELVEQLRQDDRTIYVDFTARWCATCQLNKAVVFDHPEIQGIVRSQNVALLKADWTRQDPRITKALASYGRSAVPFVLIYRADLDEPLELPELLSAQTVMDALRGEPIQQ